MVDALAKLFRNFGGVGKYFRRHTVRSSRSIYVWLSLNPSDRIPLASRLSHST